ncbi:UxaA family hydrolase [Histidinibacterium lentulum]|uniref:Altronate dehydratase n=1 Tax=Histidinibacterium lentulum TaxID=2480588 RepID=A0A3N2QY11_9RHOB|nr:altronate dehydratase family protein [Histidinibacterium lentulum]ROU00114.1 altronate dehydratase [Histidinibacterium lentulum]
MSEPILLHPSDDVVILTEKREGIAAGHKIARHGVAEGAPIRKFGQIIGYASAPIAAGEHVHSHNCNIGAHDRRYEAGADLASARAAVSPRPAAEFLGYRRPDGRVGTRNYVALCATVNCSATVIRRAAEELRTSGVLGSYPNIDGVFVLAHGTGCGMASEGPGWDNLQRVLWGYATHPNVGAAVFVGLGCEVMQLARMKAAFDGPGVGQQRFHGLTIQETGGTRATIAAIRERVEALLPEVNDISRSPCSASDLCVALQCGGSDGYSGITANPALGVASDLIAAQGGTVILAETPEIYGAEQLLIRRAASPEVADKLLERMRWWEDYTAMHGGSMDNNPSPGNKAGGLTTILEKSLGAAAKGGSGPLSEVVRYAEAPSAHGLIFMDTPGYDPVSVTGQVAGGAQIVVFTTGRGSAFGSKPAPTIKLATNERLFAAMSDDMDINCGDILGGGVSVAEKGEEIFAEVLAVASGKTSRSEALGLGDHEILPWQIGAVMWSAGAIRTSA